MDGGSFDASGFFSSHGSSHDYSSHHAHSSAAPHDHLSINSCVEPSITAHGTVPAPHVAALAVSAVTLTETPAPGPDPSPDSGPTIDCESGTQASEIAVDLASPNDKAEDVASVEVPHLAPPIPPNGTSSRRPLDSMLAVLSDPPSPTAMGDPGLSRSTARGLVPVGALLAAIILYLLQLAARSVANGENVAGSSVAIFLYVVALLFLARACRVFCNEPSR